MKIKLKKYSHPFVHDLIKSILQWKPQEVIQLIKEKYPYQKTWKEWNLERSYEELRNNDNESFANIDVAWRMSKINRVGDKLYRIILHEIKTGDYDILSIVNKYKGKRYGYSWRAVNTNSLLFVWGWSFDNFENRKKLKEYISQKIIPKGSVFICDIGTLLPLLYKSLDEIFVIRGDEK